MDRKRDFKDVRKTDTALELLGFHVRNGLTPKAADQESELFMKNVPDRTIDSIIYHNRKLSVEKAKNAKQK